MEIWNGTHGNRKTLTQATAPRHDDYVALVNQIQELQKRFNSLEAELKALKAK
jgi:uncharacterized protein involved in exopolysaccharide biosynthesis